MSSKICSMCNEYKDISLFRKDSSKKDGVGSYCKPCGAKKSSAWYVKNTEKAKLKVKEYRENNLEKCNGYVHKYTVSEKGKATKKAWAEKNKSKRKEISAKYASANKWKILSNVRKRQAAKIMAIPKWANESRISSIYLAVKCLNDFKIEKYQVDHIVQLQSDTVCGLHCEENLAIVTEKYNKSKGNRYWPDMP